MEIAEAKQIRILGYLKSLGYEPVRDKCGKYWFHSPLRDERTPSFKVDDRTNYWYDFGAGEGGDIIDLCKRLYCTESLRDTLSMIESHASVTNLLKVAPHNIERVANQNNMSNVKVSPLEHIALLSYLRTRKINLEMAKKYCKEIHYRIYRKQYFALAFTNVKGGYDMRNPYFKGCYGCKDITVIRVNDDEMQEHVCVFEGFLDFLSYMTLKLRKDDRICIQVPSDYIVLNSITQYRNFLPYGREYKYIHLYLDNDTPGINTTTSFRNEFHEKILDESVRYKEYKDLNDFIRDKMM